MTREKNSKEIKVSIIINGIAFVLGLMLHKPFLSIDDIDYAINFYGATSDTYQYGNAFIKNLYMAFLVLLQKVLPTVPWYTICFYIISFAAFVLLVKVILDICGYKNGIFFSAIILLFYTYEMYIAIKFTKIAIVIEVVTMIIAVLPQVKKRDRVISFFIFFVACLIRTNTATVGLAWAAFFILSSYIFNMNTMREKISRAIFALLLGCILFIIADKSDAIFFTNVDNYTEWEEYAVENWCRSTIQDYNVSNTNGIENIMDKYDVSENDLEIWRAWNYDFSIVKKPFVYEIVENHPNSSFILYRAVSFENISRFLKMMPLYFLKIDVFYAFMIIVIVCNFCNSTNLTKTIIASVMSLGFIVLLNYYMFLNGRYMQHRIDIGIILGAILFFVFSIGDTIILKFNYITVLIILLLFLVEPKWIMYDDVPILSEDAIKHNGEMYQMISKNQGCYYVMCMDEVGNEVRYLEAFDIPEKGTLKNVYYGQETPIIKENMKEYHINNPYLDSVKNHNICLVFRADDLTQERWEKYISDHTGEDVELVCVRRDFGHCFYKAYLKGTNKMPEKPQVDGKIKTWYIKSFDTDDGVVIEGNANLYGSDGFDTSTYLILKDKQSGEEKWLVAEQSKDEDVQCAGKYSKFSLKLDAKEYKNTRYTFKIAVESDEYIVIDSEEHEIEWKKE